MLAYNPFISPPSIFISTYVIILSKGGDFMSNAEIAKDIVVALIGNNNDRYLVDSKITQQVVECYETIFNKVKELNK